MVAAFAGQPLSAGSGLLDEGKALSAVQLLLASEVAAASGHLAREFDPRPEKIALDGILEGGLGISMSHLETMHTAQHFRESVWLPELIDRSGYAGPKAEAAILAECADRVDALLAAYEKPEGREEQLAQMRAIVDRAREEMG